jgi:DNA-binding response OmpR family regulator
MALLLVEDNRLLRTSLMRGLSEDGFVVDAAETGQAALDRLACRDVEAVILDLGLPDINGAAVLDFIRTHEIMAPVLVLTARDATRTRVDALERGADDYLVKPFHYDELVARLRAMLRRSASPRWAPLACNGLVYDCETFTVTLDGEPVSLSPRERDLLGLLLRRQGQSVTREELFSVFGYWTPTIGTTVNAHINNLRRKLGTDYVVIEPVRTIGYRLRPATTKRRLRRRAKSLHAIKTA